MKTLRCRSLSLVLRGTLLFGGSGLAAAQTAAPPTSDVRGARSLLDSWHTTTTDAKTSEPKFRGELAAFATASLQQAPAQAATGWLTLVDRFQQLNPAARNRERAAAGMPLSFRDVLGVLPPVATWPDLARAIRQRPLPTENPALSELALRLLAARLENDATAESALKTVFAEAMTKSSSMGPEKQFFATLGAGAEAPADQVAAFTRQLELRETGGNPQLNQQLAVPDLVTLAGAEAARPLLRRALLTSVANLQFSKGRETKALARVLTLEVVNELKVARWEMVDELGTSELFEALLKKFGAPATATAAAGLNGHGGFNPTNATYEPARAYYLIDLILADRTADATALATTMVGSSGSLYASFEALRRLGRETEVTEFFQQLLTEHPELPFWDRYVESAARAGRSAEALALLQRSAAAPKLTSVQRSQINRHLTAALLAADRIEEGAAELRRGLASVPEKAGASPGAETVNRAESASRLAWLGFLQQQPGWIDDAVGAVERVIQADPVTSSYSVIAFVKVLTAIGRYGDAEKLLQLGVRKQLDLTRGAPGHSSYQLQGGLTSLLHVYHAAGRPADLLVLLDETPWWVVKDAAGLSAGGSFGAHESVPPPLYQVAWAMAQTGRNDEARAVLEQVLARHSGYDPAYALLLELQGANAAAALDALAQRDPFEERPLVWKAELLRRAGQLDAAEKTARAAIAIDPSDGEQPRGDRMRVYGVLAEIFAARGDGKQAEFYRGVVRAIRLSEDADRYHQAGLLTRAVALYRQAIGDFADAYCIQSRLAVQLNELGRYEEAEEHYRRAYELMPDSFGRVESHCFGCERAFGPTRAQGVAERVFASLVEKNPAKPQVHYLFGFLRLEQGRANDALPHFRQAVKLDPDYLSAWKKIVELGEQMSLSAADRDAAALNLLRLDPLRRHSMVSFEEFRDLRELFTRIESIRAKFPPTPETVYPLAASRKQLEQLEAAGRGIPSYNLPANRALTPRELADQNRFLSTLSGMFDFQRGGMF